MELRLPRPYARDDRVDLPAHSNLNSTLAERPVPADAVAWPRRAMWALLAFVPSGLLDGVTSYISTDLASIPLLWIVPLALYLLTFVLVFARKPPLRHAWMVRLQLLLMLPLAITYEMSDANITVFIPFHLAAFYVSAMVCHGELTARRSAARYHKRLSEFRFDSRWVAAGRTREALANLDEDNQWRPPLSRGKQRVWADDYSNLLTILRLE